MARKFVEKGLLVLACSIGVVTPSLAAAGPASNPTEASAAPASSTTTTTTTTAPSSTTTSSTTTSVTTAPAASATAAAAAAPAASAATGSTAAATTAPAATAATTGAPADATATTSTTTTTTDATKTTTETKPKKGKDGYPWSTKKDTAEDTTNYSQNYENAAHSECILIAEYLGYQKNPDVRFNQPIQADYKIVKILKGPPLNKRLPIKYEFHDHTNPPTPPGWKFSEKEMPAVGSRWLIFIEHAVPHNGQFETYQGNYGRQPETEDNLNKIYELLAKQGETGY
ncbi:MAG: hypothetical protein JST89_00860 [Cyanobacteria bacterium SZAS-4]|nr:hypothetical protein [Cyanobacteria bacterium SZAS-4]